MKAIPSFKQKCPDCGLLFEKVIPSTRVSDPVPCMRCKAETVRMVSAGNFGFSHRPDGPKPQNTGVSEIDHDVDRVIGADAEMRLYEMQRRQDRKRKIIDTNQTVGDYLTRTPDGDYAVMSETERVAAKKARLMNQDAMKRISAYLKRRKAQERNQAATE